MNQKQLISAIKQLKEIKPRKDWAVLAKARIFADGAAEQEAIKVPARPQAKTAGILDILASLTFQKKLAYAFAAFVFIIVGMFGFAQNTLPGDVLFPVRKIAEQSQAALIGGNSLKNSLNNYDRRVQDLVRAVKDNRESNIPSAISEVRQSMADAVKDIAQSVKQGDSAALKEIAAEVKKIEDGQKQLQTLGVDIGGTEETKELDNILAPLVKNEIEALEKATLTEEQQEILLEIKNLYGGAEYSGALEKILLISQ